MKRYLFLLLVGVCLAIGGGLGSLNSAMADGPRSERDVRDRVRDIIEDACKRAGCDADELLDRTDKGSKDSYGKGGYGDKDDDGPKNDGKNGYGGKDDDGPKNDGKGGHGGKDDDGPKGDCKDDSHSWSGKDAECGGQHDDDDDCKKGKGGHGKGCDDDNECDGKDGHGGKDDCDEDEPDPCARTNDCNDEDEPQEPKPPVKKPEQSPPVIVPISVPTRVASPVPPAPTPTPVVRVEVISPPRSGDAGFEPMNSIDYAIRSDQFALAAGVLVILFSLLRITMGSRRR